MRWAVGVTTAPRGDEDYHREMLAATLASIQEAGWPSVTLFAEPGDYYLESQPGVYVLANRKRLGAWPNFLFALGVLRAHVPTADYMLIFQDDVLVAKECRAWLECQLTDWNWSRNVPLFGITHQRMILSLYTANATKLPNEEFRGWFAAEGRYRDPITQTNLDPNWLGVGACAIAMPPTVADLLLADPPGKGELIKTDYHLSMFCIENNIPWIQHHPSPVSHRGKVSTLGMKWNSARMEREWIEDLTGEM